MRSSRLSTAGLLLAATLLAACANLATDPSTAGKLLVPAAGWDCGMPDGIPSPEAGVLVLEAEVKLDAVYAVGRTPFGLRQAAVTQTGTMKGPKIEGTV